MKDVARVLCDEVCVEYKIWDDKTEVMASVNSAKMVNLCNEDVMLVSRKVSFFPFLVIKYTHFFISFFSVTNWIKYYKIFICFTEKFIIRRKFIYQRSSENTTSQRGQWTFSMCIFQCYLYNEKLIFSFYFILLYHLIITGCAPTIWSYMWLGLSTESVRISAYFIHIPVS